MSWQEGVAVAVVVLGLRAGAFLVAQRPAFWSEFGSRLGKAQLPLAWRHVSKRMPPEEEVAWRQAERRGQGMSGCESGGAEGSHTRSSSPDRRTLQSLLRHLSAVHLALWKLRLNWPQQPSLKANHVLGKEIIGYPKPFVWGSSPLANRVNSKKSLVDTGYSTDRARLLEADALAGPAEQYCSCSHLKLMNTLGGTGSKAVGGRLLMIEGGSTLGDCFVTAGTQ